MQAAKLRKPTKAAKLRVRPEAAKAASPLSILVLTPSWHNVPRRGAVVCCSTPGPPFLPPSRLTPGLHSQITKLNPTRSPTHPNQIPNRTAQEQESKKDNPKPRPLILRVQTRHEQNTNDNKAATTQLKHIQLSPRTRNQPRLKKTILMTQHALRSILHNLHFFFHNICPLVPQVYYVLLAIDTYSTYCILYTA